MLCQNNRIPNNITHFLVLKIPESFFARHFFADSASFSWLEKQNRENEPFVYSELKRLVNFQRPFRTHVIKVIFTAKLLPKYIFELQVTLLQKHIHQFGKLHFWTTVVQIWNFFSVESKGKLHFWMTIVQKWFYFQF